ncbi:MAG: hypothetical protein IPL46_28455 [Saprospiraceae bacterium]|nr:hypothetical protein [Saprospiraceae bacterium]
MKEYILLIFIASVGLSGLFSIHHEARAFDDPALYFDARILSRLSVKSSKISRAPSQILIDQKSNWPQIAVEISNFDPSSVYYLDIGDGSRIRLTTPTRVLSYHDAGFILLKLIKDNILIDALELAVEVDGKATAKLVSY